MIDHGASSTEPESTLSQITAIVGVEVTVRLSVRFGGRRFYIPKDPVGTALEDAIGIKAATLLARQLGGTFVDMPIGQGKRERIRALSEQGITVAEIAELLHVTERHVYTVRAEMRDGRGPNRDTTQTDLFSL